MHEISIQSKEAFEISHQLLLPFISLIASQKKRNGMQLQVAYWDAPQKHTTQKKKKKNTAIHHNTKDWAI